MTETQSKFTKKVVWITVFIFCIRCFISGTKIITDFSIYDLYGYTGEAISIATLLMFAYEKILWKYNPLEKTPVLKKRYKGSLLSTYDGVEREAMLEIKQTLLSINVVFTTGESRSKMHFIYIDERIVGIQSNIQSSVTVFHFQAECVGYIIFQLQP